MRVSLLRLFTAACLGLASFGSATAFGQVEVVGDTTLVNDLLEVVQVGQPSPTSRYWLGLQLGQLPPTVAAQLNVKQGVLITRVMPDSPALKAEMKEHDIVLKANDKELSAPEDLMKAVEEAQDREMTLVVLRSGKEVTVKLTPMKRPEEQTKNLVPADQQDIFLPHIAVWGNPHAPHDVNARFLLNALGNQQGLVGLVMGAGLPENVTIRIEQEGAKPAKIFVKQGEKTWETTGDKINELPEEVRGYVQRLLPSGQQPFLHWHRAIANADGIDPAKGPLNNAKVFVERAQKLEAQAVPFKPDVQWLPQAPQPLPRTTRTAPNTVHTDRTERKLDEVLKKLDQLSSNRFDDLQRELKSLRAEIDELRKKSEK